ncbi:NADH-ubiquinone oxidoreductase-F iron-sulfur binding region domain-containing protein [Lacisediminihabitans sp.]|uniref:NADH-ubiquinone oxidoreductase-F iron-sulfur binding region domain-containing protein n=1 Tax=Lacisediminihabitans sp. TaxID=2787631 RepID=UPI00374D123F
MSGTASGVRPPTGAGRLFASPAPDLASHLATFGPVPNASAAHLIDELQASGLQGRGGAAFPAWRKFAAVGSGQDPRSRGGAAVVVANGAEGEPRSAKDATLLRAAPHLVIDGLLLAGRTVGARELYLVTTAASLPYVARAIAERTDAAAIRLREVTEAFLSGEASAVIRSLEGGPALPRDKTRRLSASGLGGRPTLLNNVETLAQAALIARFGAEWFRRLGTEDEPGTRLVTVSGTDLAPTVREVAGGMMIAAIVRAAGGSTDGLGAVLVGGYHGAWLPAERLDTPLTRHDLAPLGAAPGAGILVLLDSASCGLRASAAIAGYLAAQSARQCGPCANGLPRMAEVLEKLAGGSRDTALPAEIRRLAALVSGRGSCHHPDGTTRLVLSALTVFSAEVKAHLAGGCLADRRARAGVAA